MRERKVVRQSLSEVVVKIENGLLTRIFLLMTLLGDIEEEIREKVV